MMKNSIYIALLLALTACGDVTTPDSEAGVERNRCTSKCDDFARGRLVRNLDLLNSGGVYSVSGRSADGEFVDNVAFVDVVVDGELLIETEMNLKPEILVYSSDTFELPETFQEVSVFVFGSVDGVGYLQQWYFTSEQSTGVEIGGLGEPEMDSYDGAYDVALGTIEISVDSGPPNYTVAEVEGFSLFATEVEQKWDGGHERSEFFEHGTVAGRKCQFASAIRYEAIVNNPPPSLLALKEETNWEGNFFNLNQDFSDASSEDSTGAKLGGTDSPVVAWISQTGKEGKCHLPTYDLVDQFAAQALEFANDNNGDVNGFGI